LFALFLGVLAASTQAAGSVLIWPLNLVIREPERAAALWLENVGHETVGLQVRVLAWDQSQGVDRYGPQTDVVGTPPFARIEPGRRQLIRLTLAKPPAGAGERAYRVLVDELPIPAGDPQGESPPRAALRFLMRYSLPLFVYPRGEPEAKRAAATGRIAPTTDGLSWHVTARDGRRFLHVRNTGPVHARLSQVRVHDESGRSHVVADGLLGYVLPGAEMQWPLPAGVVLTERDELQATLGGSDEPTIIPHRP